jgi:hypothetical protein
MQARAVVVAAAVAALATACGSEAPTLGPAAPQPKPQPNGPLVVTSVEPNMRATVSTLSSLGATPRAVPLGALPQGGPQPRWIPRTSRISVASPLGVRIAGGRPLCACAPAAAGWSRNGRKFAAPLRTRGLGVFARSGKRLKKLGVPTAAPSPQVAWSPRGDVIAYDTPEGIDFAAADGTRWNGPFPGWSPHWSPEGRRVAAVEVRAIEVWTFDFGALAPAHEKRFPLTYAASAVAWSPDGTSVVVAPGTNDLGHLLLIDVRSGKMRRVATAACDACIDVDWAPAERRSLPRHRS